MVQACDLPTAGLLRGLSFVEQGVKGAGIVWALTTMDREKGTNRSRLLCLEVGWNDALCLSSLTDVGLLHFVII